MGLERPTEAAKDVDAALAAFEALRCTAAFAVLESGGERGRLEGGLWFAKGAVLAAEDRYEEAIAAFVRAEALDDGRAHTTAERGYALAATGDYERALDTFELALARATTDDDRAYAHGGMGLALVRLGRHEQAIGVLQSNLAARLHKPDSDPQTFALLGIAYSALQRHGAAMRAFRRAWQLRTEEKRDANLARGVSAAELHLNDPAAALKFLDEVPERLKVERTLLFNRALALDGLGRRREALACRVSARQLELDKVREELARLDVPTGLARWLHPWFGAHASRVQRTVGYGLLALAASGLAAPYLQQGVTGKMDWYLLLLPSAVALGLLLASNSTSLSFEAAGVRLTAEPMAATEREIVRNAPDGLSVPSLTGATLIVPPAATRSSEAVRREA